ncbi:MAG: hypothetical protein ACI3T9_07330 [Romboutsia timonensis]
MKVDYYDWFLANGYEVNVEIEDDEALDMINSINKYEDTAKYFREDIGISENDEDNFMDVYIFNVIFKVVDNICEKYNENGIFSYMSYVDTLDVGNKLLNKLAKFIRNLDEEEDIKSDYIENLVSQHCRFEQEQKNQYKTRMSIFETVREIIQEDDANIVGEYVEKVDDIVMNKSKTNPFTKFRGRNEQTDKLIDAFDNWVDKNN